MADEIVRMLDYDRRDGDMTCKIKATAIKLAQIRIWTRHYDLEHIPCTGQYLVPGSIIGESILFSVFKEVHTDGNSHSEMCNK